MLDYNTQDAVCNQAKRARDLYHALGAPTVVNFKHMINSNAIRNCPVTVKDIEIAERVYGPDIGTLKGRTVRKKPPVVREDNIVVPDAILHLSDHLILHIDIMYVNLMPLLTSIDDRIKYCSAVPLPSRTTEEIYSALVKILRLYNNVGFTIKEIHCNC